MNKFTFECMDLYGRWTRDKREFDTYKEAIEALADFVNHAYCVHKQCVTVRLTRK